MKTFNIAISSCLVGNQVRFDGGAKTFKWATNVLSDIANFHPYCPEMQIGLPTPRKTIRLIDVDGQVQLKTDAQSDDDLSTKMHALFESVKDGFKDMDGFIVTVNSPSCGMERVKLYGENGMLIHKKAVGVFTDKIMKTYPLIPVEENGRLQDDDILYNFLERLHAYKSFKETVLKNPSKKSLIQFHSTHKYQIMAHSYSAYKSLGKLTARIDLDIKDQCFKYLSILMMGLKEIATPGQHANVLQHIQGYFKNYLDKDEKKEMTNMIDDYRNEKIEILAPKTLLSHFCRKYPNEYLKNQTYFLPFDQTLLKKVS